MKSILKVSFLLFVLMVVGHTAYSQTAALLPNASQVFLDNNGKPLSSGTVSFYIPGTMTPKMVWQDANQTTPWTQPITLNAGGRPPGDKGIYGNGTYRQIVKSSALTTIWDQPTAAVGAGSGSGTSVGDGNSVGTILAWSGMTAPNQYQFAYGQSLVRATYPELLQAVTLLTDIVCTGGSQTVTGIADTSNIPVGAALEANCIPAGSVVTSKTLSSVNVSIAANVSNNTSGRFFPYGNGNGTTTFNAPDLRGRVMPGRNNMGGVISSNLTSTYYGSSPDAVGVNGGNQSSILTQSNLPNVNFNVSIPSGQGSHTHNVNNVKGQGAYPAQPGGDSSASSATANFTTTSSTLPAMTGTAPSGGSGTAFAIIPPSITLNYIIKVTPDVSVSGLFGVASLGGMQGVIACGTGLTCAGNTISAVAPVTGITVGTTTVTGATDGYYLYSQGGILRNSKPLYKSAIDCGADPTGVADSQSAINTCLSTYSAVSLPAGTYLVGCSGGNGIALSSNQSLVGVSPGVTRINYNCTTGFAINLIGNGSNQNLSVNLENLYIDRTSGVPVSGGGLGSSNAAIITNLNSFSNLIIQNQWDGFAWPPAITGSISNVQAALNYRDGHAFLSSTTSSTFQYQIKNISSQVNNRYGYFCDVTASANSSVFLTWDQVETFANGSGGLRFIGSPTRKINDLRLSNINFSGDNGDGIYLQTYGIMTSIIGGMIEATGTTNAGRGQAIAAAHTGDGIDLRNNDGIIVSGVSMSSISQNGILTDGTNTNAVIITGNNISNSSNAVANTYDNIQIVAGTETVIIANNTTIGTSNRYGINSQSINSLVSGNTTAGATNGCKLLTGIRGTANTGGSGCQAGNDAAFTTYVGSIGPRAPMSLFPNSNRLVIQAGTSGTRWTDSTGGTNWMDLTSSSLSLLSAGMTFVLPGTVSGNTILAAHSTSGGTATFFPGSDTVVGLAATQTLTNKTISGANNTISNIGNSSLTNSTITLGSTSMALGSTNTTIAGNIIWSGIPTFSAVNVAVTGGAVTVSGVTTPQINFISTLGGNTAQYYSNGTDWALASQGVGDWVKVDLATGMLKALTSFSTPIPSTKTANYTVTNSDSSIIFNCAGSCTLTLPSAASFPGRWINIKTIAAQTVISGSANVVPLAGGAAGTAILAATAGKYAKIQSDASNWIIMEGN